MHAWCNVEALIHPGTPVLRFEQLLEVIVHVDCAVHQGAICLHIGGDEVARSCYELLLSPYALADLHHNAKSAENLL